LKALPDVFRYQRALDEFRGGKAESASLLKRMSELISLLDLTTTLSSSLSNEEVLEAALLTVMGETQSRRGCLFVRSEGGTYRLRAARGIPVLAHPSWVKANGAGLLKLCEKLKAEGLAGIEVHYSTHKPQQTAEYLNLARRLDLLVTGGSDFHGLTKPDIEVGVGRGNLKVSEKLLEPLKKAAALH